MGTLTYTYTLTNGTTADADEVMTDFNEIKTLVNGNLDSANLKNTALLTATTHGDLSASSATMHSGSSTAITDTGSYYSAAEVQTALQELGAAVGMSGGTVVGSSYIQRFIGWSYNASTPGSATVTIAADTATNGIIVELRANIGIASNSGTDRVYLPLNLKQGAAAAADLSASGSEDERFHMESQLSSSTDSRINCSATMVIDSTSVATIDFTEENIVKVGTAWDSGGGSPNNANYYIAVWVY